MQNRTASKVSNLGSIFISIGIHFKCFVCFSLPSVQHHDTDAWMFDFVRLVFDDNTYVNCVKDGTIVDNEVGVLVPCY